MLEAGSKAMEKWEARALRRDILYAMSLAHLGLASEALKAKEQVRSHPNPCHCKCLSVLILCRKYVVAAVRAQAWLPNERLLRLCTCS